MSDLDARVARRWRRRSLLDLAAPVVTDRRRFTLAGLGGLAAAAAYALGGCGSASDGADDGSDAGGDGSDGVGTDDGVVTSCTVYPEETQGPYYLDLGLVRRDITEGLDGMPLAIVIRVLGADGCGALRDVAVEIWHADPDGVYSGYPRQNGGVDTTGQTFLRGTQVTGDDGRARFDTIFPGWYPGRTSHVHFKVHLTATRVAISQLYFPEDLTAAVYRTGVYAARGQKDTSNVADSVARANPPPLTTVTASGSGYVTAIDVTVAD